MTIQIVSSMPIEAEASKKIEAVFAKKHTEQVEFRYEINSDLIGGLLVIDGDDYYDATLKGQLSMIKKLLI